MSIHVKKLKSGRPLYEVKLRTLDGRQYSRSFRTRKEAETFQVRERAARLQGIWVDPRAGKLHFGEYAAEWLRQRVALRPRTRELYEYILRRHLNPAFEKRELLAITPALVRSWHADLRSGSIGPSTAARCSAGWPCTTR